jgi:predicted nucleic acid-binding protein
VTGRVIDASILVHALIGKGPAAAAVRVRLQGIDCHAPHLIDAEVGNVLRRRTRAADITGRQAIAALRAAKDVIDYRYPHVGALAELAWTWRDNLSFYDALYVALAVGLDVPLLTSDRRLSEAPGLPANIELI